MPSLILTWQVNSKSRYFFLLQRQVLKSSAFGVVPVRMPLSNFHNPGNPSHPVRSLPLNSGTNSPASAGGFGCSTAASSGFQSTRQLGLALRNFALPASVILEFFCSSPMRFWQS